MFHGFPKPAKGLASAPVSPVSRRIVASWLLLLVATLGAGGGGIFLLKREQARLAEQRTDAADARRAAVVARAGLVVENVELLVGDMQAGLIETDLVPQLGADRAPAPDGLHGQADRTDRDQA